MVARIPFNEDTTSGDVSRWVWEQAVFLPAASHHHVLAYLALNAFVRAENQEGENVGVVMEGRSSWHAIQECTRLGRSTIDRCLVDLQNMGYIIRRQRQGYGRNLAPHIQVAWSEEDDDLRRDIRAGEKTLPPSVVWHRRSIKDATSNPSGAANVVAFPSASRGVPPWDSRSPTMGQ